MPRPQRPDLPGSIHHVMNRGIDHASVFFADSDRVEMGQRFADIHERFGVIVHAYCLMDNHFHLLLECPEGGLSDAMQRLGSLYTRHVNDRLGRDGALFRGRFASREVGDAGYLLAACRYIHRNPLALPGIDDPSDYRWSSHRTYLGYRPIPSWLRTDLVLDHWNDDRAAFDAFVSDDAVGDGTVSALRLRSMVEACRFVLDEFVDDRAAARLARLLALLWAVDRGCGRSMVMHALDIPTVGAFHSALHRARSRVSEQNELVAVIDRSEILLAAPSRLGSDPWSDQRAARAAS